MATAAPNRAQRRANGNKPDVPDDVLVLDLDDLRVREIVEIEKITEKPFDEWAETFAKPHAPKGEALMLFAYIIKKRTNPDFTMEDAGEMRIVFADQPDPTKAARKNT